MSKKINSLRRMLMPVLIMALLAMLSGCSTGGLTDATSASNTGGNGTGTDTGTAPGSITLSFTKISDGSATTSVSIDSPVKLTATAKDSAGVPIARGVMTFSTTSDLSFNPASGTALTNASGVASIEVKAGNTTGATTIKAQTTDAAGTAVSGSINVSMAAPSLSLSTLTITPAILSAGGSAGVSITVMDGSGNPFATSVPISFTSDGVQASKATITSQVYTVNGVASATYRDINYASVDTITATLSIGGTTFTKTGTITVNAASAGSISFVSATPTSIALKGTGGVGRSETSAVVFKVLDTNGNPIQKTVDFSLNTTTGGIALTANSASSDTTTGLVQTIVTAGTVSTPVRVSAQVSGSSPTISSTSDNLIISTGIPDQRSFSLAATTLNFNGWNYDGTTTDVTIRAADHFSNPVPDGTAISFRTSGGSIVDKCFASGGACTVKLTSQNPRPSYVCTIRPCPCPWNSSPAKDNIQCPVGTTVYGRAVVLATALGEESFVDLNGNGIFDAGVDTYTDMPEPFLDVNEDGARSATLEEFVDTNANGVYDGPDGIYNGILRDASIVGRTTIHDRQSLAIVFSSDEPDVRVTKDTLGTLPQVFYNGSNPIVLDKCTTTAKFNNNPVTVYVHIPDFNGNIMPAGTAVTFSTNNGEIISEKNATVMNQSSKVPGVSYPVFLKSDATQSGEGTVASPYACNNTTSSGLFSVKVVTGLKTTTFIIPVND